jgi:hypothetical protein
VRADLLRLAALLCESGEVGQTAHDDHVRPRPCGTAAAVRRGREVGG